MHNFGLKLWSVNTDYYYNEAQELYDDKIYDYIELYVVPDTLETIEKWKKLHIPFMVHCPHFAHGFNLAKVENKNSNKKIFEQVQKFADKLNACYIIVHGGVDGIIEETAKQLANFSESRALIENKPYAAIPNKMNGKYCRGYDIDEIKYVKEASGCGFCLDFGHAVCAANSLKKEPYGYCKEFLELKPDCFHLTDITDMTSPYDAHPHLGEGELDIKRILEMIPVKKRITFETVKNSKTDLNDFRKDMEWLKNLR